MSDDAPISPATLAALLAGMGLTAEEADREAAGLWAEWLTTQQQIAHLPEEEQTDIFRRWLAEEE